MNKEASSLTPSIFIETYGCSFNVSDSEAMGGLLAQSGYRIATDPAQADLIIMNTCTVKDRTYLNFEKRFAQLKTAALSGEGPRLVVAGCIPKTLAHSDLMQGVSTLGPDTIDQVTEVVEQTLAGHQLNRLQADSKSDATAARPLLPTRRRQPNIEIIPIASGCLNACTFCQTRLARGRLSSFRPGDLLDRARRAIADGVSELWLTAQDVGAYGKDCDYPLHRLLRDICALEGDFMVRLGMANPRWVWEDLNAILDALDHPKMFKFLHVPVQSGSDAVLAAMKRGNTARQFLEISEAFGQRFPEGGLMTDIIVGYPTETEEDFAQTLAVLDAVRPAAANRSKFSPRPGTAAARLPQLPGPVMAERSLRLYDKVKALAHAYHQDWVGRRDRVLIDQLKSNGTTFAHNTAYRPVVLPGQWPGVQWIDVEYVGAADFHLRARPLETALTPQTNHASQ